MKKTLAALAVLGAFAGSAAAADVQIYGEIDTGLKYQYTETDTFTESGDDVNTFEMANGINNGSRFGIKGTEDLGNGLKIGFKLENGFNSDDGTLGYESRLFGREASVSLYSNYGTLSMGRMGGLGSSAGTYDIVYAIGDAFDGGDEFAWGLAHSSRYDNMITYQSPKFYGLQVTAQYSFKENSKSGDGEEGRSTANRYAAAAITGEYGPAQFVLAYELQKHSTLIRGNGFEPDDGNTVYLGGNYDFDVAKVFLMGQYYTGLRSLDFMGLDEVTGLEDNGALFAASETGAEGFGLHLGTIVPMFGGELTVGAYWSDGSVSDVQNIGDVDFTYYGAAARYCYPLSTRTTIYTGLGYSEASVDKYQSSQNQDAKVKTGGIYLGLDHKF
ncbi:porin [Sutterella sp.]|uniref:porin n=1 Tax=Sutterella sp. TaxID=1981025 RepID=UPI0026E0D27E|nr:porin [Sutterella sp.]MDO5530566.1 porin [Sutterella sp.]